MSAPLLLSPPAQTFEVSAVADEPTVTAWERHNAEALVELACRVPWGRPFRARERSIRLDELRLAHVQGTAHAVSRDAAMVAARPTDAVGVYVALRGEAVVDLDGHRVVVRPGQVLVCDLDRPLARTFGRGLEELAVRLPRPTLTALTGPNLPGVPGGPVVVEVTTSPYARALASTVTRAVRFADAAPADPRTLVELVAVLANGDAVPLATAHRAAARAFIDDHLGDPSLGAGAVAHATGVSERHLSRLFAEAGESIPRHILGRRLDLAHHVLARGEAQRTADVAKRCGFTSLGHFSQAFSRRFGISAGEVLRSARSASRTGARQDAG